MITLKFGQDIFQSEYTLVNPVNCVGISGKGLALEFKNKYPLYFEEYRILCKSEQIVLGKPYYNKTYNIISFPTKHHWKEKSKLEPIIEGIHELKKFNLKNLACPALGCGLGGLVWNDIYHDIRQALESLDIPVELYIEFGETSICN